MGGLDWRGDSMSPRAPRHRRWQWHTGGPDTVSRLTASGASSQPPIHRCDSQPSRSNLKLRKTLGASWRVFLPSRATSSMSGRRRGGAPLTVALPLALALALGGLLLPGQATVVAAQEPARPPPSTADGEPVRAPPAAVRNPFEDWLESTEYRRPPKAWKCDALFYDAGDGCDCGCGAVDPDCNRLHHAEGGELEDMLWGCGDGEHCAEGACEPPPEPTGLSFKVAKPCEPSGAGRGAGSVYRLRVQAPRGTRFLVLYGPHRGRNALSAGLGFKVPQAAARCGGTEIHLGSAGLKVGGRVVKQVKAKQKIRVVTKEPFVEKAMCGGLHFQLVNLDTCTATSAVAGQEGAEGREQPCPSIYDGRADADFGESLASHSPRVVNGAGTRGWCVAGEGRRARAGGARRLTRRLTRPRPRPPSYPWMASFLDPHPKATQENGLSNPAFCGGAVVNDKVGTRLLQRAQVEPRTDARSKFVVTAAHCMFGDAKRGDPVLIGHNRLSNAESCCGRSEMRRIAKITMHPKCVSVVRCTADTCGSGGRRPGLTCQQVPEDPGGLLRQPLQARHRRRRAGRPDPARLVHLSAEADAPEQA